MPKPVVAQLLRSYPLISDQVDERELTVILTQLSDALERNPQGAVVEFGCYIGTTSLFIRRVLDSYGSSTEFHVYDSFAGLPDKSPADASPAGEQFKTGELAVSRKTFELQFKKAGLRLPRIHKGWFSELSKEQVPDTIGFAYLDGDYYESIGDSLKLIENRLAQGSTIVVDDYANEALPGAARAVDSWVQAKGLPIRVERSLAIIHT